MDFQSWTAALYATLAAIVSLFGAHRAWLLWRFRRRDRTELRESSANPAPFVTVQLPLFNERTVAARAMQALGALEHPRERFEIQVLDDSSDETRAIVDAEAHALRSRGVKVEVLRRTERTGFKAGALAEGLLRAKGELICVFDADFTPAPDFLKRTLGAFDDPSIDMVQARWAHLNRDESAFTRAQATLLDSHMVIAHKVRNDRGLFIHFNGTAGVWRRSAIERAGGWSFDTLTEDLDLSYRAQLAGSRFRYALEVEAPAELPADFGAFHSQQTRWARGTVQTARKLLAPIVRAKLHWRVKLEACIHFATHAGHPLVLALVALFPFAVGAAAEVRGAWLGLLLGLCTPVVLLFYETAQRALGRPFALRAVDSALAMLLGLGMSWRLARAALAGLRGPTGEFVRTPKRGEQKLRGYAASASGMPGVELLLAAWAGYGVACALRAGQPGSAAFLALYVAAFAWVGALSLRNALASRRPSLSSESANTPTPARLHAPSASGLLGPP